MDEKINQALTRDQQYLADIRAKDKFYKDLVQSLEERHN